MTDTLRHSVTYDDASHARNGNGPGVVHFLMPSWPGAVDGLPVSLAPMWSQQRDFILRSTVYQEAMWGGAVRIAISKMASLGWTADAAVKGEAATLTKRAHDLLLNAEGGRGWVRFLQKHLRDYFCTDNGAFIEIVRATRSPGSRIVGLMHLDSCRCTRTGNPEYPILYRDRLGREHELRAHQVIDLVDMADPGESYYDIGFCAAHCVYAPIRKLAAMERYVIEKVTGSRPLAIYLVSGFSEKNLTAALTTASQDQAQRGAVAYMGAVVVPVMGNDITPAIATIPLAELPDGYARKEEFDLTMLAYANALGLDIQDLQPLTGQSLGSGAQSQVLDDKASGKGLAAWRQQFSHLINQFVLSDSVTFTFIEKDWRDKKAQVDVESATIGMLATAVKDGIITAQQAVQVLVDRDILPREFLPQDETADISLSDDEKAEESTGGSAAPVAPAQGAPKLRQAIQRLIAQKADEELPIVRQTVERIRRLTELLRQSEIDLDGWSRGMEREIADGHAAAYKGAGGTNPALVDMVVTEQKKYLQAFKDDIANGLSEGWQARWGSRAEMYGESVKASYWRGRTKALPLPAVPGDGSCVTTPYSRIITDRGLIPIADVRVGDRVLTHLGRWRPVLNVLRSASHQRQGAFVRGLFGDRVGFTTDHKLCTSRGWVPVDSTDKYALPVYNIPYNHQEGGYYEQDYLSDMRGTEGSQGKRVPIVRDVAQSQDTMERPRNEGNDAFGDEGVSTKEAPKLRYALKRYALAVQKGRESIRVLLGRREEALHLSLSMALDTRLWAYTKGLCYSSQGWGSNQRPSRQFSMYQSLGSQKDSCPSIYFAGVGGARPRPHSRSYGILRAVRRVFSDKDTHQKQSFLLSRLLSRIYEALGVSAVSRMRQRNNPTVGSWAPAQILFTGMLPEETTLYDLTVAGDHSFVVEGLVVHNSQCLTRCKCAWEIEELDGSGNADAYWRRHVSDSCQTCVEREAQWAPLRIRDGVLL